MPLLLAELAETRTLFGVLSTIPFLYILYVLFVERGRSLGRQSAGVRKLIDGLRYIVLATWGVYPLAYMAPSLIDDRATAEGSARSGTRSPTCLPSRCSAWRSLS